MFNNKLLHIDPPLNMSTSLPTHVPKGFTHQPLNGSQLGDLHGGSSPREDMPRGPSFNPFVGSFGWPTPNHTCLYHDGILTTCCTICTITNNKVAI